MERPNELLDVAEAARLLRCAPGTVRNWCSAKRLPYVKIGRLTRFRRQDLLDWIEQNAVPADSGRRALPVRRRRPQRTEAQPWQL